MSTAATRSHCVCPPLYLYLYLGEDKKLYAAFMHLEKAYDRVDREVLWSVLKICGMGRQLLKGIQAFYRDKCMCEGGRGVQ